MPPLSPSDSWDCHVHIFSAQATAQTGHYRPVDCTLENIESTALGENVRRLVLVQPSVYATDNTLLLAALKSAGQRHRGVVVVDDAIDESALQAMHALGVRGVRFNLVSPVGNKTNIPETFRKIAPKLKQFGWHIQWYARPADLDAVASLHEQSGIPAVLDHLAGMGAGMGDDDPAWKALDRLSDCGSWVKLSGWYRLQADFPYQSLDVTIQKMAKLFAGRMVWGSDWPHTTFPPTAVPAYGDMRAPIKRVLSTAEQENVMTIAPSLLYE